MSNETHAAKSIDSFANHLFSVPELEVAIQEAQKSPKSVAQIFIDYLRIIQAFAQMSDEDRIIVTRAEEILAQERDQSFNSASRMTMEEYEELLGEQKLEIARFILEASNPSTQVHNDALRELCSMMLRGHELKERGRTPKDGDPDFDLAIWSHTQISDPRANTHVVIAHFIERTMSNFVADRRGMKPEKDSFLNAITNFVILKGLRNQDLTYILDMWRRPKNEGGLGWASEDRITAIDEALRISA